MEEIRDMTDTGKEITVDDMVATWQNLNKIAVLKEETNVISSIFKGYSKRQILADLRKKHPEEDLKTKDIDEFLILYKNIINHKAVNLENRYVKRLLQTQEGLSSKLLDLATMTESISRKALDEDDNANAISAIRTSADIFMKVGKMHGLFKEQPDININMQMDKLVTEISSSDSEFKKQIMNIVNTNANEEVIIDVDVEDGREEDV